ncbi:hypothetical protein LXA43DRAFT_650080 [Ganoderma leucocontextum]|nr:hypothetical protein LXA43DRAFT_650080 [Ganoderma leucocontextum]
MLSLFLALFLYAASVHSELSNFTIDDEFGDETTGLKPIYSPIGDWEQGLTCITCGINIFEIPLDTSQIYQSTWHDATHRADEDDTNITVSFNGSAVYVYHIVANSIPYVDTVTQLSFVLDGEFVGQYNHTPDSSGIIMYNVPVFVDTALSNTAHILVIRGGGRESLILFDYVVYTSEDTSGEPGGPSTLSSTSTSTSPGESPAPPSDMPTSTSPFPSTAGSSLSNHNLSLAPSRTPAQSSPLTHSLQTNSSRPTKTPSHGHSSRVSTRAIVGATVGSIAAFSLTCALLFLFCHIRRRNRGQGVHVVTLNSTGSQPATPVDVDCAKPETDSVLDIKHLSPIWKPLVPTQLYRSHRTSTRSGSSGGAVVTVGAYGHSPEGDAGVVRVDGPGGRNLSKDIVAIREELARFRAERARAKRFRA